MVGKPAPGAAPAEKQHKLYVIANNPSPARPPRQVRPPLRLICTSASPIALYYAARVRGAMEGQRRAFLEVLAAVSSGTLKL